MSLDAIQVDSAVTGDVGEAIPILFFIQSDLHHNGLDGLFQAVTAYLADDLGMTFRLVFDDPVDRAFAIQQGAQSFVNVQGFAAHNWKASAAFCASAINSFTFAAPDSSTTTKPDRISTLSFVASP